MNRGFLSIVAAALVQLACADVLHAADSAFTYQGELSHDGGPAAGAFDMDFSLWNAPDGGSQIASTIALDGVQVTDGRFSVELDFGASAFNNDDRWLKIVVNGIALSPRQPVTRAPYAIQTRGIFVDADYDVGIGTTSPGSKLEVIGHGASSAILGDHAATTGLAYGVEGRIATSEYQAAAVYGHATATTGNTRGGLFVNESSENGASGIVAKALAETGFTFGVQASVTSDEGRAINGYVPPEKSGTAIHGSATNPSGYAGYFVGRAFVRDHLRVGAQNIGPITAAEYMGVHTPVLGTGYGGVYVSTLGSDARPFYGYSSGGPVDAYHYFDGASDQWVLICGNPRVAVNKSNGAVGIGTTSPTFLLHVDGSAGKPGGGTWSVASDRRLKKNITELEGVLDDLLALRGVAFEYVDPGAIDELPGERIGMIAQDVETVFPDWVDTRDDGYRTLTFRGFEALTVEALRELRAEKDAEMTALRAEKNVDIATLRAENDALRARLDAIERILEQHDQTYFRGVGTRETVTVGPEHD